jgi:hypothetical protein
VSPVSSAAFILDYRVAPKKVPPGNPYIKGRLSTVDLLVLTNLDQVLFRIEFFYETSYLIEEVICTETFPSVSVPWRF